MSNVTNCIGLLAHGKPKPKHQIHWQVCSLVEPRTESFQLRLIQDGEWIKVEQTPEPTSAELALFAQKGDGDYRSSFKGRSDLG